MFFSENKQVQTITLGKSVESLGFGAFADTGIKTLAIPKSVRTIEESTFDGCQKLESVTFEETTEVTE